MKTCLPKVFVFLLIVFTAFFSLQQSTAQTSPLILINEIQIGGTTNSDEFVELYNPSNQNQTLTNWKLKKKSQGGTESTLSTFTDTIPAHGFLLFGQTNYDGPAAKDINYASVIGSNNTLLLYDENNLLIDKVGMGAPFESEGSPAPEPPNNSSVQRTNHQDTNNNSIDFAVTDSPNPQNKTSPIDPPLFSPSPTPLISPTPKPEVSPSPTPQLSPSPTPESSPSITPSPTTASSASPSLPPSPTSIPPSSPTVSPMPSVSPSPSSEIIFQNSNLLCVKKYLHFKILWLDFSIPQIICSVKK